MTKISVVFMSWLLVILGVPALATLRFCLPIRWRRAEWWDALLCRLGSHRCVCTCGRGCCWSCLRCDPALHHLDALREGRRRSKDARIGAHQMKVYLLKESDFEALTAAIDRDPQHGYDGGSGRVLSEAEKVQGNG